MMHVLRVTNTAQIRPLAFLVDLTRPVKLRNSGSTSPSLRLPACFPEKSRFLSVSNSGVTLMIMVQKNT